MLPVPILLHDRDIIRHEVGESDDELFFAGVFDRVVDGVALRPGDEIRIEGTRDGNEPAGLDYIEIK